MAYPTVSGYYGLKPVNEYGGLPYAGSTRMYPIATGYSTSLFCGDVVSMTTTGTLITSAYTPATSPTTAIAGTIGIFLGCQYTNSTGQTIQSQYWPASTVSNNAIAYICDDPRTVFKAVMGVQPITTYSNTSTVIGYVNTAFVGANLYYLTGNTGSTTTGNSALCLTGKILGGAGTSGNLIETAAAPFRCVGVVLESAVTITATASTSGSSATLTLAAADTTIQPGMQFIAVGTGCAQGNYITVTSANSTTVTLSSAVTVASQTVSFIGFPEALVTWNGNFHSMNNTTGI